MFNTKSLLALIVTIAVGWPIGGVIQDAQAHHSYIRVHHEHHAWPPGHHKHYNKHHKHHRHYYHGFHGPNTYQFHPPAYGVYSETKYYSFRPYYNRGHSHIIVPQEYNYNYNSGSVEFRSDEFDIRLGW